MVALVDVRRLTPRTDAVLADPRLAAAERLLLDLRSVAPADDELVVSAIRAPAG